MTQHSRANASLTPRLLLIELNESSPDYLSSMAQSLGLKNISRALSYRHAVTVTTDQVEHQGLDPWVQWVGVHCGEPTEEHGVKRLGATSIQRTPQLWHAVASGGHSWGVWGVMNAPMGDPRGGHFFMPDPWSFEEVASPSYLNDLLALPRYAATNYLEINYSKAFTAALRLVRFFAPPSHWPLLARFGLVGSKAALSTGLNVHTFTTLLDYLSVLCFLKLRREHQPHLSVNFLNHIAHLQHQILVLRARRRIRK